MKSVVRLSAVFAFLAIGFAALAFNVHADDLSPKFTAPPVNAAVNVNPDAKLDAKPVNPDAKLDAKPVNPADAPTPEGQTPLVKSGFHGNIGNHHVTVKKTNKGLLIGQIYGKYGTVYVYDNGKGYRWTEIITKPTITVYGPGQKRQDSTVELDEPAPVNVTTTRWGKVYADPRLLAGWIEGE